jgi:hypothetical protein
MFNNYNSAKNNIYKNFDKQYYNQEENIKI